MHIIFRVLLSFLLLTNVSYAEIRGKDSNRCSLLTIDNKDKDECVLVCIAGIPDGGIALLKLDSDSCK